MPLPELPVDLGDTALQADGTPEVEPVYQTHRGKMPKNRETHPQPYVPVAEGFGYYSDPD